MTRSGDFATFWQRYPRKVGRLAAEKAYARALKLATADVILAGLEAYCLTMPHEMRFRPHPATWLNQGRFFDEYPERQRHQADGEDWFDECRRLHDLSCGGRYNHAIRMDVDRMKAEGA